ncbi:MAG: hypothetical protein IPM42_10105 [Saprospiraceae bacterium]|nr:hypothetical protein [Saprospiraceae bacterium]
MKRLILMSAMFLMFFSLSVNAQSPDKSPVEKKDRTEYRKYNKEKKSDGKVYAKSEKRKNKSEYKKLKIMAKADGKVTHPERKMLKREKRKMRMQTPEDHQN